MFLSVIYSQKPKTVLNSKFRFQDYNFIVFNLVTNSELNFSTTSSYQFILEESQKKQFHIYYELGLRDLLETENSKTMKVCFYESNQLRYPLFSGKKIKLPKPCYILQLVDESDICQYYSSIPIHKTKLNLDSEFILLLRKMLEKFPIKY